MARRSALSLIELVLDGGSWTRWDVPVDRHPHDPAYERQLAEARERTGLDEAVVTGEGCLRGRRVAVVASEFGFLAGSIGVAAADRLVRAIRRATREGLPLLAAPSSGGTRMQEGAGAFVQMVRITTAIAAHRAAGLPYLVYLRNPTVGGVLASWGSLGHVTVAEPGALIGFIGPRVYEALYGSRFPAGVQVSEHLYDRGLVDAVLPPEALAAAVDRALTVLAPRPAGHGTAAGVAAGAIPADPLPPADLPAWESVTRSRRPDRPGIRRLLRLAARDVTPLSGTGQGERDPGLLLALARFGDIACVVLGQDRQGRDPDQLLGPGALREARRGMHLAQELRLPLVMVIDTPGAALSVEAEEGGLAGEIARSLFELVSLRSPSLCVLLGQGAGGAALALMPADRVLCAQHGWLSPLPPEGAAAIVHRTTDRAPELAAAQRVRSADLLAAGIVDRIIPEYPDAADEPVAFCRRLGRAIEQELAALLEREAEERLAVRQNRYGPLDPEPAAEHNMPNR